MELVVLDEDGTALSGEDRLEPFAPEHEPAAPCRGRCPGV
jgi:hypothetical protein